MAPQLESKQIGRRVGLCDPALCVCVFGGLCGCIENSFLTSGCTNSTGICSVCIDLPSRFCGRPDVLLFLLRVNISCGGLAEKNLCFG